MDNDIEGMFDASIALERKVARFYNMLSKIYSDDTAFWSKLADEEEDHAVLLEKGKELYDVSFQYFPTTAIDSNLSGARNTRLHIEILIHEYMKKKPAKRNIYLEALHIEHSSCECYFQLTTEKPETNPTIKLFRKLVGVEKDHAKRIEERMIALGI